MEMEEKQKRSGYVVDNIRQRDYLYTLGFNYNTKDDRKNPGKAIWVFDRTELLLEAIDFYIRTREKTVGGPSKNK